MEWLYDYPRQTWRSYLRRFGFPSCSEARILASMMAPLKEAAEKHLGHPITHALPSSPRLIALYPEDVWDAFEYVGLVFQQFVSRNWDRVAIDVAVNYASQGYFLCKNYKDRWGCKEEQAVLDGSKSGAYSTLNLFLMDTVLMFSVPVMISPYQFIMWRAETDFELGLEAKEGLGEDNYWDTVETRIEELLKLKEDQLDRQPMSKVFVTGIGAKE